MERPLLSRHDLYFDVTVRASANISTGLQNTKTVLRNLCETLFWVLILTRGGRGRGPALQYRGGGGGGGQLSCLKPLERKALRTLGPDWLVYFIGTESYCI